MNEPVQGKVIGSSTAASAQPRPVFLPALIFGAVLGGIIFAYRLKAGLPADTGGGQPAGLADALLSGLTSSALYAFLYAFVVWAWRTKVRPIPGLTWRSRGTGLSSWVTFLAAFILIAVLGNLLT